MLNLTMAVHAIDQMFTTFIFIPIIYILYCRFTLFHTKNDLGHKFYRLCIALTVLFLFRYFCDKFIFTAENFQIFISNRLFPFIKAIFYYDYI